MMQEVQLVWGGHDSEPPAKIAAKIAAAAAAAAVVATSCVLQETLRLRRSSKMLQLQPWPP
jgi:hypothetical protein